MRNIGIGVGAGACAGSLVGAFEAFLRLQARVPVEYQSFGYGYTLYGLAGAAAGLVFGVLLQLVSPHGRAPRRWAACFAAVFAPLVAVLLHHHLDMGVYEGDGVPLGVVAVLAGAGLVGGVLLAWVGANVLVKTPLQAISSAKGFVAAWGGGACLAWIFALSPTPEAAQAPAPAPSPGAPDIFVIAWDGWRADARGPALTPTADALALGGVEFETHVVASSSTASSVASLFSSVAVSTHAVGGPGERLSAELVTLAEVLRERGYRTLGLPNHPSLTAALGFGQGFDVYPYAPSLPFAATESTSGLTGYRLLRAAWMAQERHREVERHHERAETQYARLLGFLDAGPGPVFAYVHGMETHEPWFRYPLDGHAVGRADDPWPDAARRQELRGLYVGAVGAADAALRVLLRELDVRGRLEASVVVLTSPHGVELYDHGGWWAGSTLYDEVVVTPLVVKLPGGHRAGTRVPWQVRQIDVAPTLVDLAGGGTVDGWQGTDLFGDSFELDLEAAESTGRAGVGGLTANRDALVELRHEGSRLVALRRVGRKLVLAQRTPRGDPRRQGAPQLFDLVTDPQEEHNLATAGSTEGAAMRAALEAMVEARARAASWNQPQVMDRAERCRLCALGYLPPSDCGDCR